MDPVFCVFTHPELLQIYQNEKKDLTELFQANVSTLKEEWTRLEPAEQDELAPQIRALELKLARLMALSHGSAA